MKTKITALALIAATALSLAPKPAQASDNGLAVLGGILGGVIIASAINDSRYDACPPSRETTIVYNNGEDRCDDGYWRVVAVNVWVPPCWVVDRDDYGRCYRRYVGGRYECRNNRVWVAHERNDRGDRYGRDERYGHNERNDRGDRYGRNERGDRRYDDRRDNHGRDDREVSSGYGRRR